MALFSIFLIYFFSLFFPFDSRPLQFFLKFGQNRRNYKNFKPTWHQNTHVWEESQSNIMWHKMTTLITWEVPQNVNKIQPDICLRLKHRLKGNLVVCVWWIPISIRLYGDNHLLLEELSCDAIWVYVNNKSQVVLGTTPKAVFWSSHQKFGHLRWSDDH